jgi:hypothetical protein
MQIRLSNLRLQGIIYFLFCSGILTADAVPISNEDLVFFETQRVHLNSSDPDEIRTAIDKLSLVKSNQGIRDIISALRGVPNFPGSIQNSPVVKFYAAQALGRKGEPIAIVPLQLEFKERSQNIIERQKIKKKIQDPVSDKDSLSSPYFFAPNDISIVLACGEMLRALAILPLNEESEKIFKQSLSHKNFYIRASSADAIYLSGKIQLTAGLAELISNEKDEYAKISMVSALAGLERLPNQHFRFLINELNNPDPEIRKKASEGLVRVDLKLGATYLEKAISLENNSRVLSQMKEDYQVLTSFRVP